jgi:F-type H+-transporting ATPase subunit epsilon
MATYPPFKVTITNVAGSLYEGDVTLLAVPSQLGATTILAHHEPLIALLKKGTVTLVDDSGNTREYHIDGGVLEVSHNKAIVLV